MVKAAYFIRTSIRDGQIVIVVWLGVCGSGLESATHSGASWSDYSSPQVGFVAMATAMAMATTTAMATATALATAPGSATAGALAIATATNKTPGLRPASGSQSIIFLGMIVQQQKQELWRVVL